MLVIHTGLGVMRSTFMKLYPPFNIDQGIFKPMQAPNIQNMPTMLLHLWLKFSGEAALNSFKAARELSTTTGWPNRDTEWMSPYLVLNLINDS